VVLAMGAAVCSVALNAADHRLDGQHYSHLCRLVFACSGRSLVASWLGDAARIWMPGGGRCSYSMAPPCKINGAALLNGTTGTRCRARLRTTNLEPKTYNLKRITSNLQASTNADRYLGLIALGQRFEVIIQAQPSNSDVCN
jgi:hypothetical protein